MQRISWNLAVWSFICCLTLGCPNSPPPVESVAESSNEGEPTATEAAPAPAAPTGDSEKAMSELKEVASDVKTAGGYVTEVSFRGKETLPEGSLAQLSQFPKLSSVLLNDVAISDDDLVAIGKLTSLTNLDLRGCPVSNAGMEHLSGLTNLRVLRLSGSNGKTTVDDGGLKPLASLKSLKALLLDFLWVSGDGIQELKGLDKVEELYLAGTLVGDADLAVVVETFPKLKKLRVSKLSQVTGEGLSHVKKLDQLIDLDLSENSALFDDGMTHLSGMTKLKRLNLWRVPLTDVGVADLAPLTNLEWLNLDNTQLSDAGLDHLAGMDKLTFLHLGSTYVTDAGLSKLAGLKSLKDLKLTRTAVTEDGVAELQKSLPDTEIQLKYLGDGEQ